jgi:hypothetical protein
VNPAAFNPNNLLKVAIVIFSVLMLGAGVAVLAGVHLGPAPAKQAGVVYVHNTPTPTASPTADQTSHGGYAVPAPGPTVAPRQPAQTYVRPNPAPPPPPPPPPQPTFQRNNAITWLNFVTQGLNSFATAYNASNACLRTDYHQGNCQQSMYLAASAARGALSGESNIPACLQPAAGTYFANLHTLADDLASDANYPWNGWLPRTLTQDATTYSAYKAIDPSKCPE